MDLASGDLRALEYLMEEKKSLTVNLGGGKGYSVLDLVRIFESISGKNVRG